MRSFISTNCFYDYSLGHLLTQLILRISLKIKNLLNIMNRNYVFLLPFLQVLVEIDDEDWERREWFNVYKDNYQLFAVEQTLVLAKRSSGTQLSRGDLHPAFVSTIYFSVKSFSRNFSREIDFTEN